jgi:RNA polymerase sigma factor (sigma-70 family)
VVETFASYEWRPVGFYPYLRTVGLRVALDLVRSKKRLWFCDEEMLMRELELASDGAAPDEEDELRRSSERLQAGLERIAPRYRDVIRGRVLEERPKDEMAKAMGVSPATFDVVLHRALVALRKAVTGSGGSE